MVDTNTVIEGGLKFRDGKKWKCRWGVLRKLSPVADCLHLQLYRDSKDRFKQGQTKASLSLQTFLGVQSGFTLDKESNTIAIICQDVTVVLAFDTRERLIQWQVKIAHNLGEDEQFLVQVCTAPLRAKLTAGPARLHVLAHQFCMTVGLPPRLVGCWRISQLRRYGVVNSKFCFEGGSRCGRGEGLYVLVTDQGEEITRTFRLAAEGKLSSKKRPSSRNSSDSPKKSAQSRLSDVTGLDTICLQPPPLSLAGNLAVAGGEAGEDCCECECGRTEWQGHHGDDFADTSSVSEFTDSQNKEINAWTGEATIERCASCISKLGGLSRSSTATATITANPIASHTPTPSWTMEHWTVTGSVADRWDSGERSECCPPARPPKPDRLSAPVQPAKSPRSHGSPNSSPKKRQNIPPSQAQEGIRPTASACPCNLTVNPYDNYDVPKGPQGQSCQKENNLHSNQNPVTLDLDYYDTPKNIKESYANEYGNYDTPPPALSDRRQMCTTLHKNQLLTRVLVDHDELQLMCPCRRLVCWTDSWMLLPYCRRGSGRERTPPPPPPLHKRASEGRGQAVTDQQGSVYATVDKSKKTKNRQLQENHSSSSSDVKLSSEIINTQPLSEKELKRYSQDTSKVHHEFKTESAPMCGVSKNYMNFDFVQSLEFYENSKEMMQKTVGKSDPSQTIDKSKSTLCQSSPKVKICTKCRHECKSPKRNSNDKQDDYLMMEPSTLESLSKSSTDSLASCSSKYVPGYIPMHPIGGTSYINNQDLLKFRMCQQMLQVSERATSSPSLSDASADGFRRRSDTETHRPGSSVVFGLNQSVSASNTPYLRRRILGCVHEMVEYDGSSLLSRQRSFSTANSQRNPVECATDEKIEIHRSLRDSTNLPREPTKLIKRSVEFDVTGVNFTSQETSGFIEKEPIGNKPPQDKEENQYENVERSKLDSIEPTVHIRRSSSAPSKSSHNRDSSSSNDSGVSSCSLKKIQADFVEMDVQIAGQPLGRRYTYTRGDKNLVCECPHATLPRKSKSTDPMQGLAFHLPRVELPLKSSSAEAEVPVCHPKRDPKGCMSPGAGVPYMDSRSTSSGTSDMSDYCETLSLSSYSSTDTPDGLHFGHHVVSTMKPRSGKEYQKIDRNILEEGSKNNQPALVKSTKEDSS